MSWLTVALYAGVSLVVAAGGWEARGYWDQGTIDGQKLTIVQLTANNGTLKGNYAECRKGSDDLQASADAFRKRGDTIQADLDKARADAAVSQQKTAATIASIRAKAVPTKDMACEAAFDLLRGKM